MGLGADHYFGGGGESSIHPVILCLLILSSLLILSVRRQYVIYPLLLAAVLLPYGQVVVVAGLHFMVLRMLVLIGWVRVITSRYLTHSEPPMGALSSIDKIFLAWVIANTAAFTILWGAWDAFVNRLGFAYTYLGIYFLIRFLIRESSDVDRTIKIFAIVCCVAGLLMLNEQLTGKNLLGYFGGIPVEVTVRDGHRRAQGMFVHPLMAGAIGGTLVSLFIGFWWKDRANRTTAVCGLAGAVMMATTSMSSTSIMDVVVGVFALCMWPFRRSMRAVRWATAAVIIGLHLVMKAPVWSLIARIDLTGGSSGYHRYELINQAILRFSEWWLVGTRYQSRWGWDMWDSIDWYVNEGTEGGILTLILFVAVIVVCFKRIGTARKNADVGANRPRELFMWALGATLFTNAVSFIGISYFDQSVVIWLAFLAIVSTSTDVVTLTVPLQQFKTPVFVKDVKRKNRTRDLVPALRVGCL
jgi:hypothetical protein